MVFSLKILVILLTLVFEKCLSARILAIYPLNSKSHMMVFEKLMKGLARRGHQVDVASTFPLSKPFPNYTDIPLASPLPALVNNVDYERAQGFVHNDLVYFLATQAGNLLCEKGLENEQLQKIIQNPPKDPPYDLVMVQIFAANCFLAFGHHLKVPVLGVSPTPMYPWINDMIANPENLAIAPNGLLTYVDKMTFFQRAYNVLHTFYKKHYFNYYSSEQTEIIRKHFGPDMPGIRELEKTMALIIANSHPALNGVAPKVPGLIEVAGLHVIDDGPELPLEDKKWLDESTDGFIYFTLGSMINLETFPAHVLETIYKSFRKISPIRVFMKIQDTKKLPPGLPENVRTFSWIPQIKVLKHKNIRAFITHGGLMGSQEAVTYNVPLIGMPVLADQFLNINSYVKKNIAIRLDHDDITEEKLDFALHEILNNPLYRDTVREISRRFSDRPMSPLDTACYWVEYVIRNGDKTLRSPAFDLYWWQIALLDVYAFFILIAIFFLITVAIVLRFIMKIISENDGKNNVKSLNGKKIN